MVLPQSGFTELCVVFVVPSRKTQTHTEDKKRTAAVSQAPLQLLHFRLSVDTSSPQPTNKKEYPWVGLHVTVALRTEETKETIQSNYSLCPGKCPV